MQGKAAKPFYQIAQKTSNTTNQLHFNRLQFFVDLSSEQFLARSLFEVVAAAAVHKSAGYDVGPCWARRAALSAAKA